MRLAQFEPTKLCKIIEGLIVTADWLMANASELTIDNWVIERSNIERTAFQWKALSLIRRRLIDDAYLAFFDSRIRIMHWENCHLSQLCRLAAWCVAEMQSGDDLCVQFAYGAHFIMIGWHNRRDCVFQTIDWMITCIKQSGCRQSITCIAPCCTIDSVLNVANICLNAHCIH